MKYLVAVFVLTALASGAAPAAAQDSRSIRVAMHDLDLDTVEGRRIRDLRVARAADALCDTVNPRFAVQVHVAQQRCRAAAIASARRAVRVLARR